MSRGAGYINVKLINMKIFTVIVVFFITALTAFSLVFDDTVSSSFKNYSELRQSGIFEAGWLPPYFPMTATNIEEQHDLDLNTVKAKFSFNPSDIESIKSNCIFKSESQSEIIFQCKYRSNVGTFKLSKAGFSEYFSAPEAEI